MNDINPSNTATTDSAGAPQHWIHSWDDCNAPTNYQKPIPIPVGQEPWEALYNHAVEVFLEACKSHPQSHSLRLQPDLNMVTIIDPDESHFLFVVADSERLDFYLSEDVIKVALEKRIIVPSLGKSGLHAVVSDVTFYFGGTEFEFTHPSKIPQDILVHEIAAALSTVSKEDRQWIFEYVHEHV